MARTILIYGESGVFKTSNVAEFCCWLNARFGGKVRGVFGDNRGPLREVVEAGIMEPWDIMTHADPLGCITAASQGYWPSKLENGVATGKLTKDMSGVAGYVVEGLTEIGTLLMRNNEAKKRSTGEPLVADFNLTIDGIKFEYAMGSRGTYQFVQNQTHRYVKTGFAGLDVPYVLCTSHESKGFDDFNNPVFGPVIVGSALVDRICQWFDMALHFDKYFYELQVPGVNGAAAKKVLRTGARAYFTSHADANIKTAIWQAKLGIETYLMDGIYGMWPEGYVPLLYGVNPQAPKDGAGYYSSLRTLMEIIDPYPMVEGGAQ